MNNFIVDLDVDKELVWFRIFIKKYLAKRFQKSISYPTTLKVKRYLKNNLWIKSICM